MPVYGGTSGGANSHRLVESRIGRLCPLESMPPNIISRFCNRMNLEFLDCALGFCKVF